MNSIMQDYLESVKDCYSVLHQATTEGFTDEQQEIFKKKREGILDSIPTYAYKYFLKDIKEIRPTRDKNENLIGLSINFSQRRFGSLSIHKVIPNEPDTKFPDSFELETGRTLYWCPDKESQPYNYIDPVAYVPFSWDQLDIIKELPINTEPVYIALLKSHKYTYVDFEDRLDGYITINNVYNTITLDIACKTEEEAKALIDYCFSLMYHAYPEDIRKQLKEEIDKFTDSELEYIRNYKPEPPTVKKPTPKYTKW